MLKVLIVDDTRSVHAYVKGLFQKNHSIEFTSVMNGSEAVSLLNNTTHFDVILLDWEMPILNGPDTMSQFINMKIQIPVMMMTTKNTSEDIDKMLNMGVAEYLMKPFTVDILLSKLELITGRSLSDVA